MESKCSPHFARGDMSLDKAIAHGKERRKPYIGSKAFDPSCRNHGGCPWCEENRKFRFREEKNVTLIIFEQMNKNGGDGCDGATVDRDCRV